MTKLTLSEIIDSIRDGKRPDYEDLRYAICAMDALLTFADMSLKTLWDVELGNKNGRFFTAEKEYENQFYRLKRALAKPPKEYVGWNNDPDNPEFLKRRNISKQIFNRIMDKNNG